ncbi:MAG: hypothetical protein HYS13_09580 [Planctomycetia bacterium]|nr:hypothetical protein [Planctomycetia bacterium]
MLTGVLPSWVELDPLKSRAIDPLGLQAVADRLADRLLPGLSVLTTRARYFSFLCWARERTGTTVNEQEIHRLEVALALTESLLSESDPEGHGDCSFVGKRNIEAIRRDRDASNVLALDPRMIYKVPVWRAYRASMVQLGLLEDAQRATLTAIGNDLARAFQKSVRMRGRGRKALPAGACLSRVHESVGEKRVLRDRMGLSVRGSLDAEARDGRTRRAAFGRQMRDFYAESVLSPETVLIAFEGKTSPALPEPENTLRAAAVWEYVSLGLNLIFVAWVRAIEANELPSFRTALRQRLTARRNRPQLCDVPLADNDFDSAIARAIASLAHAVILFDRLPDQGRALLEEWPFDLARRIVDRRESARARCDDALQSLLKIHDKAKGGDAWLHWLHAPENGRLERLTINRQSKKSWQPPDKVALHGYRMAAFNRIAKDLGGL